MTSGQQHGQLPKSYEVSEVQRVRSRRLYHKLEEKRVTSQRLRNSGGCKTVPEGLCSTLLCQDYYIGH